MGSVCGVSGGQCGVKSHCFFFAAGTIFFAIILSGRKIQEGRKYTSGFCNFLFFIIRSFPNAPKRLDAVSDLVLHYSWKLEPVAAFYVERNDAILDS